MLRLELKRGKIILSPFDAGGHSTFNEIDLPGDFSVHSTVNVADLSPFDVGEHSTFNEIDLPGRLFNTFYLQCC